MYWITFPAFSGTNAASDPTRTAKMAAIRMMKDQSSDLNDIHVTNGLKQTPKTLPIRNAAILFDFRF
jgi:hypothetical protein